MYFIAGNKIEIYDYTADILQWCKDNLVLHNPDFDKKERMGLWTGNTPREFCLYERDAKKLVLPFGCVGKLKEDYPQVPFKSRIKPEQQFKCISGINLYTYQRKAVISALKRRNGVLVMPCGSGKTQTALEIISVLSIKTLWLTHTQDLLNQSMNRAKAVLTCDPQSYGTITGGKVNIGSGITFATVQTMANLDLTQYRDTWSMVIVDECHKAVGSPTKVMQFYKVLSNLSCRYKFGLTATPKRADHLEQAMFALIGDIICEVSKEEVADTTCPVNVEFVETGYMPDLDVVLAGDGTLNYASLVDDLTHDESRFRAVSEYVDSLNGSILVLGNRVEYLKKLDKAIHKKSICLSTMGHSKAAKATRKEALRQLNAGELDCVLATYQLAKEGLDVPNLRYVVFATPEKDSTTIQQASGRVGRKSEGKEYGTIIDFIDDFGMYKGWAKKRKSVYKKLGYDII